MAWKRVVRPCVLSFFFSGEWGCMATMRSAMCVLSGAGPSGARPHLNKCLMERKRLRFRMDEVSGRNCNCSALLKNFVFSVRLCKVCVYLCVRACVCWCPVCFSGVLTEALHGISSPPFGNTSHDITAPHNTCAYLH